MFGKVKVEGPGYGALGQHAENVAPLMPKNNLPWIWVAVRFGRDIGVAVHAGASRPPHAPTLARNNKELLGVLAQVTSPGDVGRSFAPPQRLQTLIEGAQLTSNVTSSFHNSPRRPGSFFQFSDVSFVTILHTSVPTCRRQQCRLPRAQLEFSTHSELSRCRASTVQSRNTQFIPIGCLRSRRSDGPFRISGVKPLAKVDFIVQARRFLVSLHTADGCRTCPAVELRGGSSAAGSA